MGADHGDILSTSNGYASNLSARLSTEWILEQFRDGATLILDNVDHQTGALAAQLSFLEAFFDTRFLVNAYYSMPHVPRFSTHYDDHEIFILQVERQKRWDIYEPTIPDPVLNHTRAGAKPSEFRANPPRWHVISAADAGTMPELDSLDLWSETIEARRRIATLPRPYFALRRQLGGQSEIADDLRLRWVPPRTISYDASRDNDQLAFSAMGKTWSFSASAQPILDFARSNRHFRVGSLIAEVGPCYGSDQEVRDCLSSMLERGLLTEDVDGWHRWTDLLHQAA